jgi:Ni,Fe-hydrogenase III large subunit
MEMNQTPKRLYAAFDVKDEEYFILYDGNNFSIDKSLENRSYKIYDIIINRHSIIGHSEYIGQGVFVFRYGPVTSWVVEPGVFHIFTYGERILAINIDLSYKSRKIQEKINGLPVAGAFPFVESVCGNFSFSHSLAYSNCIENILGLELNPIIKSYKIIGLELERIYNHLYVFSQLANAAAQKILTSYLQYLFEESLRTNFIFTSSSNKKGSRYLKGLNNIGRFNYYPDKKTLNIVKERVLNINSELRSLYSRTLESKNFLDRLHNTSVITNQYAIENSLTGPTLRACGIKEDIRTSDKFYENLIVPTISFGDSLARLEVRVEEIFESVKMVCEKIDFIDKVKNLIPLEEYEISYQDIAGTGIGAVESPSGIILYYLQLEGGVIKQCNISTPSLFGLNAFKDSLPGMIFTDFPFAFDSFGNFFADAAI